MIYNMCSVNLKQFVTKVQTAEANQEWQIQNFFLINLKNGEKLRSPSFALGLNDKLKWYLEVYPNGRSKEYENHVSLYLHVGFENSNHKVEYEFSILNKYKQKQQKKTSIYNFSGLVKDSGIGYHKFVSIDFLKNNEEDLLPGGNLTLCSSLKIGSDHETHEFVPNNLVNKCVNLADQCERYMQTCEDLGNLLKTKTLTDIVLTASDHNKLRAHKAILAARSPVFLAMFTSDMVENKESEIKIIDFSSEIVSEMLEFIYTGKINLKNFDNTVKDLYCIADKYQVMDLKNSCENFFLHLLSIENAIQLLILANRNNSENFKSSVIKFILSHKKELMSTPEFIELKSKQPSLIVDLFCSDS